MKKPTRTLREPQGARKTPIDSGKGTVHAEPVEAWGGVLQRAAKPALHVVLVSPEIPPNTGSIARLCAATYTRLHLIRPLGFSLADRYLKRAGLDYWPHVDVHVHEDWQHFERLHGHGRLHFFSARATASYLNATYAAGDYLVFGPETKGLPAALLAPHRERTYVIPIANPHVRSLNLSNAVSIVIYEALRQLGKS